MLGRGLLDRGPLGRGLLGRARAGAARDEGTTIPLILGFFLIGVLVVAGSVAASDAYLDQQSVQSICDGAALAAVTQLNDLPMYQEDFAQRDRLPIAAARDSVAAYLSRDADRASVTVESIDLGGDGAVSLVCSRTMGLAFGSLFGHPHGIAHRAVATAVAPTGS
ncbi:MAG: pilus assembly protein TadG-related protein [Frankiaceae bacterium]|nr:pilus assembly protein TadG-related protein [Frankiaceae bacterium]